jgi:putative ABC transport system permease protein
MITRVRQAIRWVRAIARSARLETDLSAELRQHIDLETADLEARGWLPPAARREALRRFGGEEAVKEQVRDARGGRWLADLGQDVRYAVRTLRRTPGFTLSAIAILAVGIGATTAIFSLFYAVLLAPLPYAQPDALVRLWETRPRGSDRSVVAPANVVDWQERARSFTDVGAHTRPFLEHLTGNGAPARVMAAAVQPEVLRALGVTPALGRTFTDDDGVSADVALISHALWRSRYGADPDVLGRILFTSDGSYTVVGVMPPGFFFPEEDVDVWMPVNRRAVDPANRAGRLFFVVARLARGATVESARADLTGIASQLTSEHPAEMTGWGVNVVPLRADMTRDVTSLFWLLLGGVGVVLLITCGNVSNLLLARAVTRDSEIAMRSALGAGRGRILQQLLIESAMLAALGCGGAVLLAPVIRKVLVQAAPPDIPFLARATIDTRMLALMAAVSVLCALLFGLAPALRLTRSRSMTLLRGGHGGPTHGHAYLRGTLLTGQVALSVMLLVGAGLFVRSFRALQATELGFDPTALLLMHVDFPRERRPEIPAQIAFYDAVVDRVGSIPGVTAAAGSTQPPGGRGLWVASFTIEGRARAGPNGREDPELVHAVTAGYFDAIGQRLARGRAFNTGDRAGGAPVAIVNESFARKHFPDGDALGQRIAISASFGATETPWRRSSG